MKRILITVCLFTLFFSCSSDDDNNVEPQSNFYGLAVGNSWNYKIYERNFQTETLEYNGIQQDISVIDTEEIDGNSYFKLKIVTSGSSDNDTYFPNDETINYRRIEDGKLLNEYNQTIFVNNDYTERLISEDDWGNFYNRTLEELATVTVDAGEFTCADMLVYAKNSEGAQMAGLDHTYYSNEIGLVSSSISFVVSGQIFYKTILNSYNIQ
ncbi:hypothetical protein [Psychroserpens luteus]|uniref:Uncharacterized protein n=1 Tax=Psychroserpens luteus TaxID=1434066 RepID=A0ABW5ZS61_9FLAO|nr:hypothetical protein [Psychroserpens luteus]